MLSGAHLVGESEGGGTRWGPAWDRAGFESWLPTSWLGDWTRARHFTSLDFSSHDNARIAPAPFHSQPQIMDAQHLPAAWGVVSKL